MWQISRPLVSFQFCGGLFASLFMTWALSAADAARGATEQRPRPLHHLPSGPGPINALEHPSPTADLHRLCLPPINGTGDQTKDSESCLRGAALFGDRSLSFDGQVACSDCHKLSKGQGRLRLHGKAETHPELPAVTPFGRPVARGRALPGPRVPSLVDIGWRPDNGRYFWNGRAPSRFASVYWPLFATHELGATHATLDPHGGDDKVAADLGSFLGRLRSGRAPWDQFVAGEPMAMNAAQQRGWKFFLDAGCQHCHGGTEFRSEHLVPLIYRNLPHDLFTNGEAVYAGDKELHAAPGTKVTLSSMPATLRNLSLRGPPWGRYGQHTTLGGFLEEHCTQHPGIQQLCKHGKAPLPPPDLNAFLLEGLLSTEFHNPPSLNRNTEHSRVFGPKEKLR